MTSIGIGIVGTGYAARTRTDAFHQDGRSHIAAIAGRDPEKTTTLAQTCGAIALTDWQALVHRDDVDLVVITTINRDHGAIAHAALQAGKHVVVEYPLSLDVAEAEQILDLARAQQKLLHVEHIELLSGIHTAIANALPHIGTPFYVRYSNLNPQRPAPDRWTYRIDLFGFPLIGALARINRLIHLFGSVTRVAAQSRFWGNMLPSDPFTSCLATAQLTFSSGLVAELIYGKGEALWQAERTLAVHGEKGAIKIDGEAGTLILPDREQPLDMGSRRGLFAKDTAMVLDHLTTGASLYFFPEASLYALKVADAMRQSTETGESVKVL
ncbi:Gfo/Idh/MocA family protein [Vacuolonema iberomarrocanum]|uniref:Gfo/Idh/MocA family protein n=1 Tax=Vacuolonema iberomarrocanum TaxID=3454632 RepID=UPI0019F1CECC|nr:Gfo/Idh/MocA family oxidoreductase [filamentous cyanobacterium LEGE 07170]